MKISSIILSGGRATRMGGVDKGLVLFQQKPLIAHVIERLKPQTDEIMINANRHLKQYQTFNYSVLEDEHENFIGPLAGFYVGLTHATHDYLLTAPCDSPLLPSKLTERLLTDLMQKKADIAVACSDGHPHPVFSLCKKSVLPSLVDFLANGGRKVSAWQKSLNYIEVDFSQPNQHGITESFLNLNTLEELNALASTSTQSAEINP